MVGESQVEPIEPERFGEFARQQPREFDPRNPLDQFTHEPTECQPVVPVGLARSMDRTCALQNTDHTIPIEHFLGIPNHVPDAIEP